MNIRTDLAVEQINSDRLPDGVKKYSRGKAFDITEIVIETDEHRPTLGKGKGRYITLESKSLSRFSSNYEDMAEELADELKTFLPSGEILVAGLGNRDITPDAIGPWAAEKVLATRHLKNELEEDEDKFLTSLRPVSCLAGGVLGQTGIETAELIKAVCREIKPSAVIAVDALACSDVERLGTTIQLCDSGISPGSGVANSRRELSEATLGIPIIAVGIPTVVDMHTILHSFGNCEISDNTPNMMVTPRDIDRLAERGAELIAFGINLALQPSLSFDDVRGLF
ncbi:MAG: GPR endopeptidase [Ruminococcus sp.]|nr:GPR endopeptidase [Ruminococcus sp.]